jgi:hypothetical protein
MVDALNPMTGLPPPAKKAEPETGTRSVQVQVSFNIPHVNEQDATTPEPLNTDAYAGKGAVGSKGPIAGGRFVLYPTRMGRSRRGGFFASVSQYNKSLTNGENRLQVDSQVIAAGFAGEIANAFNPIGHPNDDFYLGFMSFQIFVGPAVFNTKMTHYLNETAENPITRQSVGLMASLQTRAVTIGTGGFLLHLAINTTYAFTVGKFHGGGEGSENYLQLFSPVAVLEYQY